MTNYADEANLLMEDNFGIIAKKFQLTIVGVSSLILGNGMVGFVKNSWKPGASEKLQEVPSKGISIFTALRVHFHILSHAHFEKVADYCVKEKAEVDYPSLKIIINSAGLLSVDFMYYLIHSIFICFSIKTLLLHIFEFLPIAIFIYTLTV